MDFNRQSNRPVQRVAPTPRHTTPSTPPTPTPVGADTVHAVQTTPKNNRGLKHVLSGAVLTVALLGGGYALGNTMPISTSSEFSRVDTSKNQAVFLTNDQVYFGKIIDITDNVVVMEKIYYLQGTAATQAGAEHGAPAAGSEQNMALAKLGNELHGPEDRMQINRDQVLFWENLKSDGKVSEAIKAYKP